MKVTHRSQSLLILQEKPVLWWIIGGMFIATGFSFFIQAFTLELFGLFWYILLAGFITLAGYNMLCLAPFVTYRFDLTLNKLILKRRGLFGAEFVEHRLSEIQDVTVESCSYGDTYRVSIALISGNHLSLTHYYDSNKIDKQKTVSWIKSFLNLHPAPIKIDVL
ncbi:hypothetical protein [Mastigocoleus sp. MO_188.B34]|uniref:hypothetical protein n=1 Tax=Mastigocoleus sp. MO_188.B34 TaxID=3036635 RepID=UPI002608321C|nr:hypothetical protein [Mastigocoleus sp. MO_188.B34]MDJ0696504.1 hypothetical protein [Mastigocoleus sp. MO_188.B34]